MSILQWKNFSIRGPQNSSQEITETTEDWDANVHKKKLLFILISSRRGVYRVTTKGQKYPISPNMSSICKFKNG